MGHSRAFISLLLLTGCVVGQMMTKVSFDELSPGMTLGEVETYVGKPWEIHPLPLGQFEAIYSERLTFGDGRRGERLYILHFRDGRMVSKRMECPEPPSSSIQHRF